MADQKRWFKVWTSLLVDMDSMTNEVIGAWTRLGCRAALVGAKGVVTFEGWAHLARFLNVSVEDAPRLINQLRNVSLEEGKTRHGELSVTFKNWVKYQEDSTQAERQKASRSKRRREETRGDEKRTTPPYAPPHRPTAQSPDPAPTTWPEPLQDVHEWLVAHAVPAALHDPGYWQRIDDWLGPEQSGVYYLPELAKYLAWHEAQPAAQRHKDLKRGFRKWLAKSEYWSQSRAQTAAFKAARR